MAQQNNNNNSIQFYSILVYLCAESTARWPITETAKYINIIIITIIIQLCFIGVIAQQNNNNNIFFPYGSTAPWGPRPRHCTTLHDHTLDTPHSVGLLWTRDQQVAETSTWQHTTLTRETSMPPAEFEPTILVSERPQTHALDRAATGIGNNNNNNKSLRFAYHRVIFLQSLSQEAINYLNECRTAYLSTI
jgi:hypothetical protein